MNNNRINKMRYEVIEKSTGINAQYIHSCSVIVTTDGNVAWWDDSAGWSIDEDQDRWEIRILELSSPE